MDPEYSCALLSDPRGWWLLQLRSGGNPLAPGQLTCFGGRREAGEGAEACLRRELAEELGWCPAVLAQAVDLHDGGRFIARFFRGALAVPLSQLRVEAGSVAILVPPSALPGLPVSPWHRRVLTAVARREPIVDLARPGPSA